jgi:ankyrin repeat protein
MSKLDKEQKAKFELQCDKAMEADDLDKLKEILNTDFFINAPIKYKQSCMDYLVAIGYKHEKIAKWALTNNELGIRGNIHENANRPLRLAAQYNVKFAKYLLTSPELEKKAKIDATNDGSSALLCAIEKGNFEFVKYLLTSKELPKKASLHKGKKSFDDPLCKACEKNQTQIIKYLLTSQEIKNKADISKFDYAALLSIIYHDNLEIFNFFIDNKLIDIESKKEDLFAKAVIADSRNIVNKIESYFEKKPQITELSYRKTSLFYQIAACAHNSRLERHSFLYEILERTNFLPTEEEKQKMNHFYMYKDNEPAKPFSEYLAIREEKINLENSLKNNPSNNKLKI